MPHQQPAASPRLERRGSQCAEWRASDRTPLCVLVLLVLLFQVCGGGAVSAQSPSALDVDIMPVSEIERGMRGYGLSVFSGSEPRRFEVEVVGTLENLNPGLSFIMANLSGENLEETGVIGGMSGSPVYLDGKLAGAVAFSWSFAQGALAGITPIESMRALGDLPEGAVARSAGRPGTGDEALRSLLSGDFAALFDRGHSSDDLNTWLRRASLANSVSPSLGGAAVEGAGAAMQLVTVGFADTNRERILSSLPWTTAPRSSSSAGRADEHRDLPALTAGGPVAAMLVGGDLLMAVNGTVTERRGDEILAFGHPYLGLGPVSLPMAKAEVVAVVSSRMSSFKLSNIGAVVGAFDEDRLAGMRGQVGALAKTTPMQVTIRHPKEGETVFDLQLADFEPMRPMLVASSVLQCIESATRSSGNGGFDLEARFTLADRDDLVVKQSFDGGSPAIDAAIYLLQVSAFLELTELAEVEVSAIDVAVEQFDEIRTLNLEDAFAARRQVEPGSTVDIRLKLRGYRGEVRSEDLQVQIPQDAAPGNYYLFIGDGVSVDAARSKMEPPKDRDFDSGLQRLRDLHSARDLTILAVRPGRGVVSDGGALGSLPGSLRALWKSSDAGQVKGTTLAVQSERVVPFGVPLSGVARVDLVIPRRSQP